MRIAYKIDVGFAGCGDEGEIDLPDNMTDEELDNYMTDMAYDWAQQWVGDTRLYSEEEWEEDEDQFWESVYGCWERMD